MSETSTVPNPGSNEAEAIEAWNRRAALPVPAGAVEAKAVAWRYRWKLDDEWTGWHVSNASQKSRHLKDLEEYPLYTYPAPSPSPAGDEVQGAIAKELDRAEKVLDYAGYSRLASAVFKAAALLVQLSEQNAALTAERDVARNNLVTAWNAFNGVVADEYDDIPYVIDAADGDLAEQIRSLSSQAEASRALLAEAVGVVERGRRVLAMMIDPNTIAGTSTQHAWAQCVEAEADARELVTKIRSAS